MAAPTNPVSVDDNGGSLTVDGPLTDAELRATPVPVSGTVSVVEPVSVDDNGGSLTVDGTVSVDNFPVVVTPPKFKSIAVSASGDNLLVAAVASKKIRVIGYMLTTDVGGAGLNIKFRSGTTDITGAMFMDKGIVLSYAGTIDGPACETAVNTALNLNVSSSGKNITGHLTYVEI